MELDLLYRTSPVGVAVLDLCFLPVNEALAEFPRDLAREERSWTAEASRHNAAFARSLFRGSKTLRQVAVSRR